MTYFDKIRRLYGLLSEENYGFTENEVAELEKRLNIALPIQLRTYYLTLGKHEAVNYSHNRLLQPVGEQVDFSPDDYLVFYEENQAVVFWGIKREDLSRPNPPVYGNVASAEWNPNWYEECATTEGFLLFAAVYNGVLGGLRYNANYLEAVQPAVVAYIGKNWQELADISNASQRIYTKNYDEMISLSFNDQQQCSGIFIGTNHEDRFNHMIDKLEVDWHYLSTEDMDDENFEEEA